MQDFRFKTSPLISECDLKLQIKLSGLMRQMQNAGELHLRHLDLGSERLFAEGMVFLLSKLRAKIVRLPTAFEEITVQTAPKTPKGVQFLREQNFLDKDGGYIVKGVTSWVLVEPATRKILRPNAFPYDMQTENAEDDSVASLKIPAPAEAETVFEYTVRYTNLDVNSHMNNTIYGDIIQDAIPLEIMKNKSITQLDLIFEHEALENEKLDVRHYQTGESTHYVGAHKPDGRVCFSSTVYFG